MSPNPSFLDYKLLLPVPASNFVALRRTETAIGIRCMSLILNGVFAITELDNIPLQWKCSRGVLRCGLHCRAIVGVRQLQLVLAANVLNEIASGRDGHDVPASVRVGIAKQSCTHPTNQSDIGSKLGSLGVTPIGTLL